MVSRSEWFISYKVPKLSENKEYIAGPYYSIFAAFDAATDIDGYEGVCDCKVYKENVDDLIDNKLSID